MKPKNVPVVAVIFVAVAALSGCSTAGAPPSPQTRGSVARVLETYAEAMKSGDYSKVRFTPDVTFQGSLHPDLIIGEAPVSSFLLQVSQGVREIRVTRHVIDGEFAAVVAELVTKDGVVVPFCEVFRVVDGRIAQIRPYFDPRPLIR